MDEKANGESRLRRRNKAALGKVLDALDRAVRPLVASDPEVARYLTRAKAIPFVLEKRGGHPDPTFRPTASPSEGIWITRWLLKQGWWANQFFVTRPPPSLDCRFPEQSSPAHVWRTRDWVFFGTFLGWATLVIFLSLGQILRPADPERAYWAPAFLGVTALLFLSAGILQRLARQRWENLLFQLSLVLLVQNATFAASRGVRIAVKGIEPGIEHWFIPALFLGVLGLLAIVVAQAQSLQFARESIGQRLEEVISTKVRARSTSVDGQKTIVLLDQAREIIPVDWKPMSFFSRLAGYPAAWNWIRCLRSTTSY